MKYLISIAETAPNSDIHQYFADNNITVLEQFFNLGKVYFVESGDVPPASSILEYLIDDRLTTITKRINECIELFDVDDNWWKLSTLNITDFEKASYTHCKNSTPIDVYIMDSGIKADHPEFEGFTIENVYTYDESYDDFDGHGTAVASILSGTTNSLVNVKLKNVKVFGSRVTYLIDLIRALDTIIGAAKNSPNIAIVNMSWTISKESFFEAQLQKLFNNNILVVCAAGNTDSLISDMTPASVDAAYTVGAYGSDFRPCDYTEYTGYPSTRTSLVNYGQIDVWAPGNNIKVANINGGYSIGGGTSLAAAIFTACVAYTIGSYYNTNDSKKLATFGFLRGVINGYAIAQSSLIDYSQTRGQYQIFNISRIATIKSQIAYATDPFFITNLTVKNNQPIYLKVMNTESMTNIIIDNLPFDLQLEDGWLTGTPKIQFPTTPEGPTESLTYDVTVQYNVVKDESTVHIVTIPITITKLTPLTLSNN